VQTEENLASTGESIEYILKSVEKLMWMYCRLQWYSSPDHMGRSPSKEKIIIGDAATANNRSQPFLTLTQERQQDLD
jgi:hypothetical protein